MTTALYRRYRPDSFEDVIGQEHVTVPLMTALSKDRISHAYLFSGPRGCGKTTSARVLARCLNCVEGPTPTPCGACESCRDLATGGPGALDVIEIDAASHGGVDDARDLRERATFAPVRDRYKIFIIDEAHMVTSAGFNALLKIVEEPPPHIKFIFATTEPDKVIGTIRSRTHHYPFRLVPPEPLMEYLERLCVQEDVDVEPGVLSLVIRSGGGSVRDTLSVLDQLMAGAAVGGIGYDLAVNLLGYTPDALLDDVVDAVAASDAQTVFRVVDRVVQSGQDPRRFVEDLLERFRDLVIVKAMPDSASSVLHGMPEDQIRRLEAQAAQLGAGEISRAADITNHALTEMVGATSPRLHLELLMARLMLPSSDATERGLAARLDRIERRLAYGGAPEGPDAGSQTPPGTSPTTGGQAPSGAPDSSEAATPGPAVPEGSSPGLSGAALARAAMKRTETTRAGTPTTAPGQQPAEPSTPVPPPGPTAAPSADWGGGWGVMPEPVTSEPVAPEPAAPDPASPAPTAEQPEHPERAQAGPPQPEPRAEPAPPDQAHPASVQRRPETEGQAGAPRHPAEERPAPEPAGPQGASASQVEMIRRAWPEILAHLEEESRLIWMLVSQNASVSGFDGQLLTIGFSGDGPRDTVQRRGGDQVIAQAVHAVLGIQPRLDLITGGSAPAGGPGPKAEGRPTPAAPRPEPAPEVAPRPGPPVPAESRPAPQRAASPPAGPPLAEPPSAGPPESEWPAAPGTWSPSAPATGGGRPGGSPDELDDADDLPTRSEPVEEAATGPGLPPPPEDLGADGVPISDWYGHDEGPRDDGVPPPPEDDEGGPGDSGTAARPWGERSVPRPEPGTRGIPRPEPGMGSIPRPEAEAGAIPRPEPGRGGIPVFARPEAELKAEFEARVADSRRANGPASADQAPAAPAPPTPGAGTPHHRRASRFQQMMEQYQQTQSGGRPPEPGRPAAASSPADAGRHGAPAPAAPPGPPSGTAEGAPGASGASGTGGSSSPGGGGSVDWSDDVPSEDDVTIEESGMAGRKVVERLLGARLVEERMLDGSPLS